MGEKKKTSQNVVVIVLAILTIISLIGLTASLIVYYNQSSALQDKDKQITDLQSQLSTPKLVSIGLQYTDNRGDAPFLHITGYAVNVGAATANNCIIHVNAIQNGNITIIDTNATIASSIDAGAYQAIDVQFPYTGPAIEAYTSYLSWST